MLDYTKAAIKKVVADLKRVNYVRSVITQCVYIAYLVYTLIALRGLIALNATLLGLATAYFAFFLCMTACGKAPDGKPVQKRIATIYRYAKLFAQLFNLGVMLYSVGATAKNASALSIIFSALLIVAWILQVVFEVIIKYAVNKAHLLIEGLEADFEQATKPVRAVGNFFKKMTGKTVEPQKEPSKHRQTLDKLVAEEKARKKQAKLDAKAERKRQKLERKGITYGELASEEQNALPEPVAEGEEILLDEVAIALPEPERKKKTKRKE